jgi:hypothetical protein
MHKGDDTFVLDLVRADRLLLSYKRGVIDRAEVRRQLFTECGVPSHLLDTAIEEIEDISLSEAEHRVE